MNKRKRMRKGDVTSALIEKYKAFVELMVSVGVLGMFDEHMNKKIR